MNWQTTCSSLFPISNNTISVYILNILLCGQKLSASFGFGLTFCAHTTWSHNWFHIDICIYIKLYMF